MKDISNALEARQGKPTFHPMTPFQEVIAEGVQTSLASVLGYTKPANNLSDTRNIQNTRPKTDAEIRADFLDASKRLFGI